MPLAGALFHQLSTFGNPDALANGFVCFQFSHTLPLFVCTTYLGMITIVIILPSMIGGFSTSPMAAIS